MGSEKLKIIYAWNYFEWGGAQIYFFGLIRRIREHADITIVLPENSDKQLITFIENLGVETYFFPVENYRKSTTSIFDKPRLHLEKFAAERALLKALFRHDLAGAIVHVELAPWQSLYSLIRLCRRSNVFITMHNSFPPVPGWRKAIWKAKFALISRNENFHIFPSNNDAKNALKPYVTQEFLDRTKVTYTNVDPDEIAQALTSKIDKDLLREKFGLPKNRSLVFCVGQFIDRKGRWTFLDAARRVTEKRSDTAFVWIANSKPSDEDLAKARSYGLEDNFFLILSEEVGKEHLDLFKLLRLADLFVLASTQEGLPISLLEAMALGIASISTNVNAIPEAVHHLETAWLIEPNDAPALADAVETLLNDDALRKRLANDGQKFVLKEFNEIAVAEIALIEYRRAVGARK